MNGGPSLPHAASCGSCKDLCRESSMPPPQPVRAMSSRVSDVECDDLLALHRAKSSGAVLSKSARLSRSRSGAPEPGAKPLADLDESAPCCIICYDEFDRRHPSLRLPCACQEGRFENHVAVHYGCIRAWAAQKSTCPLCRAPLTCAANQGFTLPASADLVSWVSSPLPIEAGVVQCFVRVRNGLGAPIYDLFLEGPLSQRLHLLTATWVRGMGALRTSYIISHPAGGARNEPKPVARVQGNLFGTRWSIVAEPDAHAPPPTAVPPPVGGRVASSYDAIDGSQGGGSDSSFSRCKATPRSAPSTAARKELCLVGYKANRFCLDSGPRVVSIAAPSVTEDGELECSCFPTENDGILAGGLTSARTGATPPPHVSSFKNRQPVWDERYEAYVLNFLGRVRVASVKNFQIVQTDNLASETLLQFGRVSSTVFTQDVQWPFSIVQAFGICLTSVATKLGVK